MLLKHSLIGVHDFVCQKPACLLKHLQYLGRCGMVVRQALVLVCDIICIIEIRQEKGRLITRAVPAEGLIEE